MRNSLTLIMSTMLKNGRVWAIDRVDADEKGGIKAKQKFPRKVMVWLGACSKSITPLAILDERTVDHSCCVRKIHPIALKYGNKVFGNDWIFQQDDPKLCQHYFTHRCRRNSSPSFIDKDH